MNKQTAGVQPADIQPQTQTITAPEKANNFEKGFSSKKLFLFERDKELKQLMYAMLVGEHLFIQGEAGTGKSLLANNAFTLVENSKVFSIQMSEATLSEHLFGAYDMLTWKNKGVLMRDITNSILEADFAFIDEIFDGREDVLRTLLGILNERKFMEGRQQEDAKLHTCVATANYQTINEKTIPILDRFLFKAIVKPLKNKHNRIAMYKQHIAKKGKLTAFPVKPLLNIKQLKDFTDKLYSGAVTIEDKVLKVYDEMILEYTKEINATKKKFISSRTTNKLLDIVKAAVLLDNRTKAEFTDLFEIKYGLCTINDNEEENTFDKVYKRCVESLEDELLEITELEQTEQALKLDDFKNVNLQPNEYVTRMKSLKIALEKLKRMETSTNKATEKKDILKQRVNTIYDESKQKFFAKQDLT